MNRTFFVFKQLSARDFLKYSYSGYSFSRVFFWQCFINLLKLLCWGIYVISGSNKLRERERARERRWDVFGWPVFGSGAGFVSEAVVKGLQCSGPQGASHFKAWICLGGTSYLRKLFISIAFLFALFLPSTFASCLVLVVVIISGLPSLSASLTICSIRNNQQTLFKLLLTNIYFLIMSVFLLFTTCSFPPAVSVFPACSLPLTYVHPQCHYSSFLSYSVLLFLPFSFLSSSLWPVTERIINEHHKALSLLAVLWWVCQLCHSEQNHAALLFDPHFKEGSPLFSAQRSNCVLILDGAKNPNCFKTSQCRAQIAQRGDSDNHFWRTFTFMLPCDRFPDFRLQSKFRSLGWKTGLR